MEFISSVHILSFLLVKFFSNVTQFFVQIRYCFLNFPLKVENCIKICLISISDSLIGINSLHTLWRCFLEVETQSDAYVKMHHYFFIENWYDYCYYFLSLSRFFVHSKICFWSTGWIPHLLGNALQTIKTCFKPRSQANKPSLMLHSPKKARQPRMRFYYPI